MSNEREAGVTDHEARTGLWRSEQLVLCRDDETGLRAVIAVDDTTLGRALGGVRFKPYPTTDAAITEAQRLAAAMTRKNAVAGLPYGGGKSVIVDRGHVEDRDALMRAFGRFVARLGGTYFPGVDMGTTTGDLATMAEAGAVVSCSDEDPSPWTAAGVWAAMRAAVEHVDGRPDLAGTRVLVQGAGHVGATLARLIARDGGSVLISDVDGDRAAALAAELGGSTVATDAVLGTACDVLAPCAVAGVLGPDTVGGLAARMVVGAANDTLVDAATADLLARRGVVYVPDFVANAGGVVHIRALDAGWDAARLEAEVSAIGPRVGAILDEARTTGATPLATAEAMAMRRLEAARASRPPAPSLAGARG